MRSQPKQLSSSMRLTKRISLRPVYPILSTRFRERENVRSNFAASPRTAGLSECVAGSPVFRKKNPPPPPPVSRNTFTHPGPPHSPHIVPPLLFPLLLR